jgi:steroid 5-alpha reductase family enzyme
MLHLSSVRNSLYFWPIAGVSAIAVFFFGWAVQISAQNWVGQAVWGGFAGIIALVLLTMAVRDARRTSLSRVASARRFNGAS